MRVVMTPAAKDFITPLTMQAVSGNAVHTDLLDTDAEAAMGHIELARWADLILVAPATADFIARYRQGLADDLLSTLCLASDAPVFLAPAMNQAMWRDPATQENVVTLTARGTTFLGPGSGAQACGDTGPGRMLEPLALIDAVESVLDARPLDGLRVMVTAGPTREALDPVRFLSNHSSGKMGYAIAAAAAAAGALTTLISGPVSLVTPERVRRIAVESALEMHDAVMAEINSTDIFIAVAAVADYRPAAVASQKIKKKEEASLSLELVSNPDILMTVSQTAPEVFTVGFAAETQNLIENAREKLARKNLDMVIANDVSDRAIGFESAYNAVTVVGRHFNEELKMASKTRIAEQIIDLVSSRFLEKSASRKQAT